MSILIILLDIVKELSLGEHKMQWNALRAVAQVHRVAARLKNKIVKSLGTSRHGGRYLGAKGCCKNYIRLYPAVGRNVEPDPSEIWLVVRLGLSESLAAEMEIEILVFLQQQNWKESGSSWCRLNEEQLGTVGH